MVRVKMQKVEGTDGLKEETYYSTSAVLDSGHDGNRHDAYDHPLVRDRLSKTTFGGNGHGNRSSLGESKN